MDRSSISLRVDKVILVFGSAILFVFFRLGLTSVQQRSSFFLISSDYFALDPTIIMAIILDCSGGSGGGSVSGSVGVDEDYCYL